MGEYSGHSPRYLSAVLLEGFEGRPRFGPHDAERRQSAGQMFTAIPAPCLLFSKIKKSAKKLFLVRWLFFNNRRRKKQVNVNLLFDTGKHETEMTPQIECALWDRGIV